MDKPLHERNLRAALMVSPECPYPLTGGGAHRTACLLECLASRFAVDLIVFRQPGDPDPAGAIPARLVRDLMVIALPCHRRGVLARAARNAGRLMRNMPPLNDRFRGFGGRMSSFLLGKKYATGVIEHFWCAGYREQIAPHCECTVLDLHNVESTLLRRLADVQRWPVSGALRRFARAALELERRWLPEFSLVLAASAEDMAAVTRTAPESNVRVCPNTLPFAPRPREREEDVIVFSGNFEYQPNLDAVQYFHRNIWPSLIRERPGLKWRLVGRNQASVPAVVARDQSVELTGPVRDAVCELARAKLVVVPLRVGSGTRVKILEAWAAGRPVVSTSVGAEGLEARPGEHLLIEDAPHKFAEAVCRLLDSEDLRRRIGDAGRRLFEEKYTREAGWAALDAAGLWCNGIGRGAVYTDRCR